MKSANAKLQTNLVGRKVHLLTDEDVREEAGRQVPPLDSETLKNLTAERWYPAVKKHRQRFGDQIGEIVAVHLSDKGHLVYTIVFGGELVELMPELWRLHESEATTTAF
jgi:hypothetical protein